MLGGLPWSTTCTLATSSCLVHMPRLFQIASNKLHCILKRISLMQLDLIKNETCCFLNSKVACLTNIATVGIFFLLSYEMCMQKRMRGSVPSFCHVFYNDLLRNNTGHLLTEGEYINVFILSLYRSICGTGREDRAKNCDTRGLQSCSKARLGSTSCYKNKIKQWRQLCSYSTCKKEKPSKQPRRAACRAWQHAWWHPVFTTDGNCFVGWPTGQSQKASVSHSLLPQNAFPLSRQDATFAFWAPFISATV